MRGGCGVRDAGRVVRDGAALVGDDPRGLRDVEGRAAADPDDHVEAAVPHAIRQLVGEREGRLAGPLDDAVEPKSAALGRREGVDHRGVFCDGLLDDDQRGRRAERRERASEARRARRRRRRCAPAGARGTA